MSDAHLAGPLDAAPLARLLQEMARHYGEPDRISAMREAADLLVAPASRAGPFCLVAPGEGTGERRTLHGLAVLAGFFPARDFTWGLLLKDLYVAEAARGSGVARALMAAVAAFAAARGYSRVDWTTDRGNARARGFYGALGVPIAAKLFYRLEGEALAAAARDGWAAPVPEAAR